MSIERSIKSTSCISPDHLRFHLSEWKMLSGESIRVSKQDLDPIKVFRLKNFAFICRNIKVLRSQLPLKNDFYSDKPANKDVQSEGIEPLVKICQVCGCRGPMLCGKCKKVSYCGQLHQKVDWKIHKQFCVQDNEIDDVPLSEILFPEYEIDIEDEEPLEDGKKESDKEAEARRMKEYENLVKEGKVGVMNDISDKELEDFSESKEDKLFGKFKKNVDGYETQVIRYHRHGQPLWISDHGVLNSGFVPNCEICGSRRTFEFQVMPQMLNELKNYDLDWGIIAVFTCENDCHTNDKYVQEFCYKQDLTETEESGNEIDMQKLKLNDRIQSGINKNGSTSSNGSESTAQQPNKSSSSKNEKSKKHAKSNQKKAFKESDNWD